MSTYCRFELLAASFLLGLMEFLLATLVLVPNPFEPAHAVLASRGVHAEFAAIMLTIASMTMYGSARPKRACRQMGLVLSGFMLLIVFGVLMASSWFSLSTMVLLVMGLAAFYLYGADAHVHVRDRRRASAGP